MNRTKTRLALFVASICLCTSVWAERVAPTFPDFTTLESGKTYYLYNVGTGKFLTRSTVSSTYYPGVGTYGAAITVAQASNGSYTLRFADGTTTYYLYAETSTISSQSGVGNNCYFAIKDSLGGYVIQRSTANKTYYVADEYVGYADGAANDRIVPNLTEGNIVWQLMETAVAEQLVVVQQQMYDKAKKNLDEHIFEAHSIEEAKALQEANGGYIKTMWCGELECELKMKEVAGMSSRCIPFAQENLGDTCPCCGKPASKMVYWGVAY